MPAVCTRKGVSSKWINRLRHLQGREIRSSQSRFVRGLCSWEVSSRCRQRLGGGVRSMWCRKVFGGKWGVFRNYLPEVCIRQVFSCHGSIGVQGLQHWNVLKSDGSHNGFRVRAVPCGYILNYIWGHFCGCVFRLPERHIFWISRGRITIRVHQLQEGKILDCRRGYNLSHM